MDYSKFLPQRKSIADVDIKTKEQEEAEREEAQVKNIMESMKAIRETAQVVDEVKVKDLDKSQHNVRIDTESREFKTKRGGK